MQLVRPDYLGIRVPKRLETLRPCVVEIIGELSAVMRGFLFTRELKPETVLCHTAIGVLANLS